MKLKSMQLVGFKSFAEKTTIDFQSGLTAIVGPNGSGKSNVIEAIRWVLGEQSAKHLRSTKMTDVIFSGSKSHRALNRAEVTLTFDNSDHYLNTNYTEVTVTRKLFRNGDSIYYLNQKECRLRDINNLLMDTGVGIGSFSIISQGNVEAIFNSKPEERRNLIETTAGIYKYRQRKQLADHRLGETNDNLSRVNDIILELESQVQTLRTQSKAASEYQRLQASLGQWHQKQLAGNAQRFVAEYTANEKAYQEADKQVKALNQAIDSLRQQKQGIQAQLDELTIAQEKSQSKLLKATSQMEQYNSQIKLASQQSTFKTEQLTNAKADLEHLVSQYSEIENQVITANEAQTTQQNIIEQHQAQLKASRVKQLAAKLTTVNEQLTSFRDQYLELLQRSSDLKNRLNYASKDSEQFHRQQTAINARITDNQAAVEKLKGQLQRLKDALDTKQSALHKINDRIASNNSQVQRLRQSADHNQSDWYRALQKSQELKANRDGLVEFQNQHGGYLQGSRNLLNHRDELNGIIGSVADFLDVESDYVNAIETALGSRLQQIMVTDNQSGREAIQFMTVHKLGRVTLLPINSLTNHSVPPAILKQAERIEGFVAVGNQLVQMPAQYQLVRDYLLGNVLVAVDLAAAIKIGTAINHRFRVVSLDGQVVNAGGSITGGANQKRFTGMLVQKEKLHQLNQAVQESKQKLASLEQSVKTSQADLKQAQQQNDLDQQNQLALKQDVQMLSGQVQQLQTTIENKQREAASQRVNLQTLSANFAQAADVDFKDELAAVNKRISENQSAVKRANQAKQDLEQQHQSALNDEQTKREQLLLAQSEARHVEQKITDLNAQLATNQSQQIKLNQTIEHLNEQINGQLTSAALNNKIGVVKQNQADLKQQIADTKQSITKLKQVLAPIDEQITQKQDALLQTQSTVEHLKQRIQTTTAQLKSVRTLASQKYGLTLQQLVDCTVNEDLKAINQRMTKLQTQIEALGPVNINSITQFDEVNERYQFLKQQADDLIQSKRQLESTMNQMDATVKQRFKTTFDQLQSAFRTTFKEIFGGGDAKLKLTDPHHLLTTGIEIMVQPPGKRFRSMLLLSGGERSLTAIALLFSILKLQPVPFVILDEAESALDPANVDRFARYIQRLRDQTQFIVITHRKETMVYADNLYGVTMQDSGISKVLTVDLKNAQATKG